MSKGNLKSMSGAARFLIHKNDECLRETLLFSACHIHQDRQLDQRWKAPPIGFTPCRL